MTTDARVDEYLAGLPPTQRELLQALRSRIAALAPTAEETISYAMPAFRVGGRFLLSYAGWKQHCSIYPIDDDLLRAHATALDGYATTKGSLHFDGARPLPDDVLADLVARRLATVGPPAA